ncbi:unnamed protein product [Closterium sp. Naga37s-1]|nr:unnamed protein product [Closterium sp. Naga37s-1]
MPPVTFLCLPISPPLHDSSHPPTHPSPVNIFSPRFHPHPSPSILFSPRFHPHPSPSILFSPRFHPHPSPSILFSPRFHPHPSSLLSHPYTNPFLTPAAAHADITLDAHTSPTSPTPPLFGLPPSSSLTLLAFLLEAEEYFSRGRDGGPFPSHPQPILLICPLFRPIRTKHPFSSQLCFHPFPPPNPHLTRPVPPLISRCSVCIACGIFIFPLHGLPIQPGHVYLGILVEQSAGLVGLGGESGDSGVGRGLEGVHPYTHPYTPDDGGCLRWWFASSVHCTSSCHASKPSSAPSAAPNAPASTSAVGAHWCVGRPVHHVVAHAPPTACC